MPDYRDSLTFAELVDLVTYIKSLDGGDRDHHHHEANAPQEQTAGPVRVRVVYTEPGAAGGHAHGAAPAKPTGHFDGLRRRRDDRRAVPYLPVVGGDPSGRKRGAHGAPAADDRRLRLPLRRRRHAARRHDEDHADPRAAAVKTMGAAAGRFAKADHAELRLGVTELGLLARFVHLSASILIVGSAALVLLAGRSDRPTALAWESRVVALTRALIWLALGAGLAVLAHQTAILESSVVAALEPRALARVALETRFGHVWLVRQGLLLLSGLVSLRLDVRRAVDWRAARGETAILGALALAALGAAGHSAAVEPPAAAAIAADWATCSPPASGPAPCRRWSPAARGQPARPAPTPRPYAVLAARRFSRAALILMTALLATGILITACRSLGRRAPRHALRAAARAQARARPRGARRGRARAPAPAARPRRRGHDGRAPGHAASGRTPWAVEAACVLAILGVVTALGVSPPARHEQPDWPLSFRLAVGALGDTPDAWPSCWSAARSPCWACGRALLARAARRAVAAARGRRRADARGPRDGAAAIRDRRLSDDLPASGRALPGRLGRRRRRALRARLRGVPRAVGAGDGPAARAFLAAAARSARPSRGAAHGG